MKKNFYLAVLSVIVFSVFMVPIIKGLEVLFNYNFHFFGLVLTVLLGAKLYNYILEKK